LTTGRSAPSITPCCAAVITSDQAIGSDAAKAVHGVGVDLGELHAQLHAPQVVRLVDRVPRVPEVAEAVIEEAQHLDAVFLLEGLVQFRPDIAVEQAIGLVVAADEVGHEERRHLGEHGARRAGGIADRDVAGLHRVHDLEFLGEERGALEIHDQLALGTVRDLFGEPVESDRGALRHGVDVREHQLLRRGLRESRCAAEGENAREAAGALEDRAARGRGGDKTCAHGRLPNLYGVDTDLRRRAGCGNLREGQES